LKIDMKVGKEITRFAIAGIIAGATDFGIYYFLIHFLSFSLAKGISFACAGIVSYLFNKYWIFQYNRSSSYPEMGRYMLINFLALGINVVTNQSILNLWPGAVFLALIIASVLTGFFTFVCFKWWVLEPCCKRGFILCGGNGSRGDF
jgi:putative flippase GtrA